ncbi:hypothetical protein T484DRAFT_1760385 [Baffinella frigidus]|nr:hypothetical protein T484DRAFT_1760385 [Cryptophyta sp. CCMP2293]
MPAGGSDPSRSYIAKGSFDSFARPGTGSSKLLPEQMAMVLRKKIHPRRALVEQMLRAKDLEGVGLISKKGLLQVLRNCEVFLTPPMLADVLRFFAIDPEPPTVNIEEISAFLRVAAVNDHPSSPHAHSSPRAPHATTHAYSSAESGSVGPFGATGPSKGGYAMDDASLAGGGGATGVWGAGGTGSWGAPERIGTRASGSQTARARLQSRGMGEGGAGAALKPQWDAVTRMFAALRPQWDAVTRMFMNEQGKLNESALTQTVFYKILKSFISRFDRELGAQIWAALRRRGAIKNGGVDYMDFRRVIDPPLSSMPLQRTFTGRVERAMISEEVDPAAPHPFASRRSGTSGAVFGGGARPGTGGGLKGMLSAAAAAGNGSRPATQQSRRW